MRTITNIKALSDFRLECLFNDGSRKIADIKPYLSAEAFRPLADPRIFSSMLLNQGYSILFNFIYQRQVLKDAALLCQSFPCRNVQPLS
jgi:hypothetical protein